MAFQRTSSNIPIAIDRENYGEAIHPRGLKNVLSSGRKHTGPKQAFGELKNVIHNQQNSTQTPKATPFKIFTTTNNSSTKKSGVASNEAKAKLVNKEKQNITKKVNKFVKDPIAESDDPLCLWAQKIALTDSEIDRLIKGYGNEFEVPTPPKPSVEPFPNIFKDNNGREVDLFDPMAFFDDEIIPVKTPKLLDDSFEDELLAFKDNNGRQVDLFDPMAFFDDEIIPFKTPKTPKLPDDSFEKELFDELLAF